MAKNKELRDARRAQIEAWYASTLRKRVRASPADDWQWAPPFRDERDRTYFEVRLLPPRQQGAPWQVRCSGNDDTSIVRFFDNEERARAVYDSINDFTQMKTLRGRGFKED